MPDGNALTTKAPRRARLPAAFAALAFAALSIAAHAQSAPPAASAPGVSSAGDSAASGDAAGGGAPGGGAEGDQSTDIAKKLENPIGDLYNVPFQNNTNFGYGPHSGTQNILNIQPVIPIHLTPDWNVITRTIIPLVWTPDVSPAPSVPFGVAPTTFSAFLSPAKPTNGWLWGVGPVVQIPTISNRDLGSSVWGGGPSAVLVYMNGPWVAGALANNVWSLGGVETGPGGKSYETFLTQPFVNYNFGGGWYVGSSPIITPTGVLRGPSGLSRSARREAV